MKYITENAFRVLGLPSKSSLKEIINRIDEIKTFQSINKKVKYDSDLEYLLGPVDRSSMSLERAFEELNKKTERIYHIFFCFWLENEIDRKAFDYLKSKEIKRAIKVWTDALYSNGNIQNKVIYKKNLLLLGLIYSYKNFKDDNLIKGFNFLLGSLKYLNELFTSEEFIEKFEEFLNFNINRIEILENITYLIFKSIKEPLYNLIEFNNLDVVKKILNFFLENLSSEKIKARIIRNSILPITKDIENLLNAFNGNINARFLTLIEFYNNAKKILNKLNKILPENSLERKLWNDKVAEFLLDMTINYFNNTFDVKNTFEICLLLKEIEMSTVLRERFYKNFEILKIHLSQINLFDKEETEEDNKEQLDLFNNEDFEEKIEEQPENHDGVYEYDVEGDKNNDIEYENDTDIEENEKEVEKKLETISKDILSISSVISEIIYLLEEYEKKSNYKSSIVKLASQISFMLTVLFEEYKNKDFDEEEFLNRILIWLEKEYGEILKQFNNIRDTTYDHIIVSKIKFLLEKLSNGNTNKENDIILTKEIKLKLPPVKISFFIIFIIFVLDVLNLYLYSEKIKDIIIITAISLNIFWFFCIHEIHRVLLDLFGKKYPISPKKAVLYHFIPFYNIYWFFKWPNKIAENINKLKNKKIMKKNWAGFWLLIGALLGYYITDYFRFIIFFIILSRINSKIQRIISEKD